MVRVGAAVRNDLDGQPTNTRTKFMQVDEGTIQLLGPMNSTHLVAGVVNVPCLRVQLNRADL
jgi:hypothetical protein